MGMVELKERDYHLIGPASVLFECEVTDQGVLRYQLPGRDPTEVRLGNRLAGSKVAVVSQPGLLHVFDAADPGGDLRAMAFFAQDEIQVLVYGGEVPILLDQDGRARPAKDPLDAVRSISLRALWDPHPPRVGFRLLLNVENRQFFAEELMRFVQSSKDLNRAELWFEASDGTFAVTRYTAQERETQRLVREREIDVFPLRWPSLPRERVRHYSAGTAPVAEGGNGGAAPTRTSPKAPAAAPAKPQTTRLPVKDLLPALRGIEGEPARLWLEIEANLELLDAPRTYKLLWGFPHVVGEKTRNWPIYKIEEVFGELPGPALQLLFDEYPLDLCVRLCDDHPHRDEMFGYLRDHEIERLLSTPLDKFPNNAEGARRMLRVGPLVDDKTVRRVWRLLLGWMNADFGRQQERAIHQKKDEIAKRLQRARDQITGGARGTSRH